MPVLLLALLLLTVDCGSTCEDIARDRAAFAQRKAKPHGPDARLTIPFSTLDPLLSRHLAGRAPIAIALPVAKLGLDAELSARVSALRTTKAVDGKVGIIAEVGLFDGNVAVVDATLETAVTPTVRTHERPALLLVLAGSDLASVTPRTTPESRARLTRWLRAKLPRVARVFADEALVGVVSDQLLAWFARELWPTVRGPLLGGRELTTEIALPELPIARVAVRSNDVALQIDLQTDLPITDAEPLPPTNDTRLTLLVSGPTAAALVNDSMDHGRVPGRFSAAGKPKADGPYEARIAWRHDDHPLRVHLWQSDARRGECRSAVMAGRLEARVERDELVVAVRDGTIGAVRGGAFTEAFAWLDALWRDAIEVVFRVASVVSLGDTQPMQLRVRDVRVDASMLRFELEAR